MIIRTEKTDKSEYGIIGQLHKAVFKHDFEAQLISELRCGPNFEKELSIIAEENGEVIGHILFTRVTIENTVNSFKAVVLGPLAVSPKYQGMGIGTKLCEEGISRCKMQGENIVLVCGGDYYCRFGFLPAVNFSVFRPNPIKGENFKLLELTKDAAAGVSGVVNYPKAFLPSLLNWYKGVI